MTKHYIFSEYFLIEIQVKAALRKELLIPLFVKLLIQLQKLFISTLWICKRLYKVEINNK